MQEQEETAKCGLASRLLRSLERLRDLRAPVGRSTKKEKPMDYGVIKQKPIGKSYEILTRWHSVQVRELNCPFDSCKSRLLFGARWARRTLQYILSTHCSPFVHIRRNDYCGM